MKLEALHIKLSFCWLLHVLAKAAPCRAAFLGHHCVGSDSALTSCQTPTYSKVAIIAQPPPLIARMTTQLHGIHRPANEFSRTLTPDRIHRGRDHVMELTATTEECQALAERFDLPALTRLQATVFLRQLGSSSSSSSSNHGDLSVTGSMSYTVTRICVRTNQNFVVTAEHQPLQAVVRPALPVAGLWQHQQQEQKQDPDDEITPKNKQQSSTNNSNGVHSKNSNKKQSSLRNTTVDDMDVVELQRLIERQQQDNDWDDDVIEDEGIYPAGGVIDVGELVAQLLWLSLDPYPKKPGTDAVQISISSDSYQ